MSQRLLGQEAGRVLQTKMASRQGCENKAEIPGWLHWAEWWERR